MGPEEPRRRLVADQSPASFELAFTASVEARASVREQNLELTLEPSEVRALILAQHDRIRALLGLIDEKANVLLSAPVVSARDQELTRSLAVALCSTMAVHIELENRVLVRVLADVDAWGAVRVERLQSEHAAQLALLRDYLREIGRASASRVALAMTAKRLVAIIREDMAMEEAEVLTPELLSDSAIRSDVETG
jgi:hypothetical protein